MKILLLIAVIAGSLFGRAPIYNVLINETVPKGYHKESIKKVKVLVTEARLYLQNKYRKKVEFKYTETTITNKDDIKKLLKKEDARFFVRLQIVKKASKKNLEKVFYNLVIFDNKNGRMKTIKTKAIIRDKKIVQISKGDMKSAGKKIAKVFKKK